MKVLSPKHMGLNMKETWVPMVVSRVRITPVQATKFVDLEGEQQNPTERGLPITIYHRY